MKACKFCKHWQKDTEYTTLGFCNNNLNIYLHSTLDSDDVVTNQFSTDQYFGCNQWERIELSGMTKVPKLFGEGENSKLQYRRVANVRTFEDFPVIQHLNEVLLRIFAGEQTVKTDDADLNRYAAALKAARLTIQNLLRATTYNPDPSDQEIEMQKMRTRIMELSTVEDTAAMLAIKDNYISEMAERIDLVKERNTVLLKTNDELRRRDSAWSGHWWYRLGKRLWIVK